MDNDIAAIQSLLDRATEKALKLIEKRARKIMREHPECKEFVMGMGSAFFAVEYRWHDPDYPDDDMDRSEHWSVCGMWTDGYVKRPSWLDPLSSIFDEFDSILKLSGCPMTIAAYDNRADT